MGGVLIEIAGEREMLALLGSNWTREEMWRRWLASPVVRAHETGKITADAFADGLIAEFDLDIDRQGFQASFDRWIVGPFADTFALLDQARQRHRTVLATNISRSHWDAIARSGVLERIDVVAASFDIGKIKPDADYFHHALELAGAPAEDAIFLDDNEINCVGARAVGIEAHCVRGADEARHVLIACGWI